MADARLVIPAGQNASERLNNFIQSIKSKDPEQKEFLQAFEEVVHSLAPVFEKEPKYYALMQQIAEPERTIIFRVPWIDDAGKQRINRGFRIQFNSALGPYKGGLRLHPTVNLSILKFLGFEQIFKNSLTGLAMGGAKGGSDFDPKGKSDNEVMRFCQSFMTELHRHIGPNCDVPAGDIGTGGREIGYMYGQYKRLTRQWESVLTGKDLKWGGSLIRPESTGYGAVYFVENLLASQGRSLKGTKCVISGSGNVAQYCMEKLLQLGAVPLTLSDSTGTVFEPQGFTMAKWEKIMELKNVKRGRLSEYAASESSCKYFPGKQPWGICDCDIAFPSACENEIDGKAAQELAKGGCKIVVEGANMPSTADAIETYKSVGITLCPGKAANAGGVAVSGLEMAQNAGRASWTREEVDKKLRAIMKNIYDSSVAAAEKYGRPGDLISGANIAGFLKVADAMIEQGCI